MTSTSSRPIKRAKKNKALRLVNNPYVLDAGKTLYSNGARSSLITWYLNVLCKSTEEIRLTSSSTIYWQVSKRPLLNYAAFNKGRIITNGMATLVWTWQSMNKDYGLCGVILTMLADFTLLKLMCTAMLLFIRAPWLQVRAYAWFIYF